MTELCDDGILRDLCTSFSEAAGTAGAVKPRPVPFRGNGRSLWIEMSGGGEQKRKYIDGTVSVAIPFDLKLRFRDLSPSDRLDAEAFVESFPLPCGIRREGSPVITAGTGSFSVCSCRFVARRNLTGDSAADFEFQLSDGTWATPGIGFVSFSIIEKADTSSHRYVGDDETLTSVDGVAYSAEAELEPVSDAAADVAALSVGDTLRVRRAGKVFTFVCISREAGAETVKMKFASCAETEAEDE